MIACPHPPCRKPTTPSHHLLTVVICAVLVVLEQCPSSYRRHSRRPTRPARTPPKAASRPWRCESATWGRRSTAFASKAPWAPKSRPLDPSAGLHRLTGALGSAGRSLFWALYPVRARDPSSRPGGDLSPGGGARLGLVPGRGQVPVEQAGGDLVAEERPDRAAPPPVLPPFRVLGGIQ